MHTKVIKSLRVPVSEGASLEGGLELLDACMDDVAYARILLSNGNSSFDWRDAESGNSLLHILVYCDKQEQVKLLLESGADVNIVNKNNETPLHWCARLNSLKTARALLSHGAHVDAADNACSTPLHYAALAGALEIVPLLLETADVTLPDLDGVTALELCVGKSPSAFATRVLLLRHYKAQGLTVPKPVRVKKADPSLGGGGSGGEGGSRDRSGGGGGSGSGGGSGGSGMENVLGPELRADTVRAMMGAGAGMSSKMGAGMGAVDVTSPRVDYPVDVDGYERALSRASPNRRASVSRARGEGRKGAGAAAAAAEIVGAVGGDGLSPSGKNTRFWVGRMMPNEGSAKSPVRRESVLRRSLMVPTLSTKGEFEPATEEDAEGSDGWRSTTGSGGSSPVVRFPPAERVPMLLTPMLTPALPGTLGREHDHSRYLDVILSVEHCTDCHNHAGSLRHDPLKYATMAQRVLFALIGAVLEADLAVRVFALRARPESSRLGAFEVTVCVNVTPPLRGHAPVQKSDVGGMGVGPGGGLGETVAEALAAVASQKPKEDWSGSQGSAQSSAKAPQSALLVYAKAKPLPSGWTTHCVHSKLASKSFPGVRSVCDAAVAFLRTALSDSSQALGSAIHAATAARASKFAAVAGGAGAGAGTGFGAVGGKHMAQAHARQQQVWVEYLTSSAHPHLPFDLSDAQLWRYEGAKGASTAHKRAMQQSFEQWSQRMKIPPRVEHSPLNLMPAPLFELAKEKEKVEKEEEGGEEDTGKGTQGEHAKSTGPPIPKHPAGPYLDFEFASSVADRPCFERAVMKHFLVLDATPTAALLHEDPL